MAAKRARLAGPPRRGLGKTDAPSSRRRSPDVLIRLKPVRDGESRAQLLGDDPLVLQMSVYPDWGTHS